MRFVFVHGSIVEQDAIGADIVGMYDLLRERQQCYLYGQYVEVGGRNVLSQAEAANLLAQPDTVAVYHHSIYWADGETLLSNAKARLVFKYHNITPPDFFADSEPHWEQCILGRAQTYRLIYRFKSALWLSDSRYNLSEIGAEILPNRAVVPPFLSTIASRRIAPNQELLKQLLDSPAFHVLMIGRFAPNKGHALFLDILGACRESGERPVVGIVVGKVDLGFRGYYDRIVSEAAQNGLADRLRVVGCVSDADLFAYYLGSDAYLCCSDHEGFCVPVVEAQSTYLPVVAKNTGAVRETLGSGQILLGDRPADYVDALRRLWTDESYWREMVRHGWTNYLERFTHERIASKFTRTLENYLGASLCG